MFTISKLMAEHGVQAVFSDRSGGCSDSPFDTLNLGFDLGDTQENVNENLELLCAQSGLIIPHQSHQVHGVDVLMCTGMGYVHKEEADVLIATKPAIPVAVRTADCAPILLADKQAGVVAAVHAGWKGTVAQVVQAAVRRMCELGAQKDSILASIGPCIGLCCLEVNDDIVSLLKSASGEDISEMRSGVLYVDLVKANMQQLQSVGIKGRHIETIHVCTACHQQPRYFSYRRDQGITGRQLSIIMLPLSCSS